MAAHGHGMAGSDETTAPRLERVTLRASVACTGPSTGQRRDGKGARISGHVERHLRQGQPWRRWKKTAIPPLPKLNWTDSGVEEVEKSMAKLRMSWPTRFCDGARARARWSRGGYCCGATGERRKPRNEIRTDELVGRRAGCFSSRGRPCQGIHGAWQREQETGDECHPRGARCLMAIRYGSSHSDDLNRLTA